MSQDRPKAAPRRTPQEEAVDTYVQAMKKCDLKRCPPDEWELARAGVHLRQLLQSFEAAGQDKSLSAALKAVRDQSPEAETALLRTLNHYQDRQPEFFPAQQVQRKQEQEMEASARNDEQRQACQQALLDEQGATMGATPPQAAQLGPQATLRAQTQGNAALTQGHATRDGYLSQHERKKKYGRGPFANGPAPQQD